MKLTIVFMFIASYAIAQAPTTQEEYNYVTKGYKLDIETGRDIKKGYIIKDGFLCCGASTYSFEFKYLIREASNELAAIVIIAKRVDTWSGTTITYLCLPNQLDSPFYADYLKAVGAWDKPMLLEYQKAFMVLAFPGIQQQYKK